MAVSRAAVVRWVGVHFWMPMGSFCYSVPPQAVSSVIFSDMYSFPTLHEFIAVGIVKYK